MNQLTFQDTQKLLQSIQAVYRFKNLDTFGQDTLTILEQLVSSDVSFGVQENASLYSVSESRVVSLAPDFERLMAGEIGQKSEQYVPENPLFRNLPAVLKEAHTFSDFITLEDLQRTDGYQEVTQHIGFDDQIGLVLFTDAPTIPFASGEFSYYILYRPWEQFSERDRLLLNLIKPHLTQAYETAIFCQKQQQEITHLQESLDQTGVIFLDPAGKLQWVTMQAHQWLQYYIPSIQSFRQLPESIQVWVDHQLTCLNSGDDFSTICSPLRLQRGDRQLVIRLTRDQQSDRYLLLLAEEQNLSVEAALEKLGLTPRESEVLAGVMRGLNSMAIAQALQINTSTVRKHLENIYRKLRVQSQTEAVAKALEQLGTLNQP
jgi:DNA-binding CsgD family transcriptional regulator